MKTVGEEVAAPIEAMIAPSLESMGYEIVRVLFTGGGSPTLQVMAERRDGGGMTAENCAEMSRAISALLDVEDPIAGAYDLEVSSPGLDRPLVRREDFSKFAGRLVKIEAVRAIDGRRRFQGKLLGMDGDRVQIEHKSETVDIDFDNIRRAKLLLTDKLIAKAAKLQSVD
ncbi:ribosome maturation factor RimP [Rhodospirillaceae bacterium AH-315-P19]|nr:ribosome maturation factor RimP [Rhodospirillaceae bacterium AH-315-P19]